MTNKEFAASLEKRTQVFTILILHISKDLPDTVEGRAIRHQLSKSGSSIGANYREANRSRSKADFINKVRICESEASETVYWLNIIASMNWGKPTLIVAGLNEAIEILALFTAISKKLKL